MLKTMLKIALIILLALALAELGQEDPGYILINYSGFIIETSLMVVIVLVILTIMAITLISYCIKPFWNRLKPISSNPRQEKLNSHLIKGMLSLSDGDWFSAQKQLNRIPKNTSTSIIAIVGQARAAYELGQEAKALAYLEDAQKLDKKNGGKYKHHLLLAECQFAIASTDYALAMRALNKVSANHQTKAFWKLKAKVLLLTQQWHQLYALLPKIRQDKLFGEEQLLDLEVQCFAALMHDQPLETIQEFWKSIPVKRKLLSELAQVKFTALLNINEPKLAFELAQEQVQRGINTDWAVHLTKLTSIDWQTRYNLVTKYMGNNTSDTQVSKALGLLAYQGEDFATATNHLNHALQLQPQDLATQLLVFKIEKQQNQAPSPEDQLEIIVDKVQVI